MGARSIDHADPARVLLVCPTDRLRRWLTRWLELSGVVVQEPGDADPDVVLVGAAAQEADSGLLANLRREHVDVPMVVLSEPPARVLMDDPAAAPDPYLLHLAQLVDAATDLRRDTRYLRRPYDTPEGASAHELTIQGARNLVRAMEARGVHDPGDSERVAAFAVILADELGLENTEHIRLSAELRDVGRLGIARGIWSKTGPLAPEERREVRRHPMSGLRMLKPLLDDADILAGIVWHHERWDGSGYPDGLRGEDIPAVARVISVAEALAALTAERPYRPARDWEGALAEVVHGRGSQFAPDVIEALIAAAPRLRKRHHELAASATST